VHTTIDTTPTGELITARLQAEIDAAAAGGGGRVVVTPGVHRTGALQLRSNIELHLEPGAVLQFDPDPELYPVVTALWEGVERQVHMPCLYADGEVGVAITGLGTIDGGGQAWWRRQRARELSHPRPTLIGLHSCERVTIRDVFLRNSPAWTVHPALCRDVAVSGVRILNPADSPNTDGIDPESCSNVRISDCHIDVGDDCIAIKAGKERATGVVAGSGEHSPCENITVTGCTMVHGHGGVVIGSEMSGSVRNVVITGCVFQGTDRGIRIKTRRGRGGVVEDVRVSNVVMDGVMCPFVINPFYRGGDDGKTELIRDRSARPVGEGTPVLRRFHVAHVTARRAHASAGFIYGLPEQPLEDVTFHDVSISFADDAQPGVPAMADGVEPVVRGGLELGNVIDSDFSRVRVLGAEGSPVTATGCTRVVLDVRSGDDRDG
jgi:polygalacturonase